MVKYICFLTASLLLFSCNEGMNDVLSRTPRDPYPEVPIVQSFNGDFSINIRWSDDEAVDVYHLYRAKDSVDPVYELVYSGTGTVYKDVFYLYNDGEMYLYRLGKQRGKKLFVDLATRGRAGLGVVSPSLRDFQESNDSRNTATHLNTNELYANSWLYNSNYLDEVNIFDEDWYYIIIPPNWKASVLLIDSDPIPAQTANHFKIDIWGRGTDSIISQLEKVIDNPTDEYITVFFKIYPDFSVFQLYHSQGGYGSYGAFIRYTIKISELRKD